MNGFNEFWAIWPRKVARKEALKCYTRARKTATDEQIYDGAKAYAASVVDKETRYLLHASTFLNQERWTDEYRPDPDGEQQRTDSGRRALLDSVGLGVAGSGPGAGSSGRVH